MAFNHLSHQTTYSLLSINIQWSPSDEIERHMYRETRAHRTYLFHIFWQYVWRYLLKFCQFIYLFFVLIAFNERFKPISIEDLSLSFVCRCQLTGWCEQHVQTLLTTIPKMTIRFIQFIWSALYTNTIPYHPQMFAKYEINVTYILFTIYIVWQLYDTQKPNEYNAFFIIERIEIICLCSMSIQFSALNWILVAQWHFK